MPEMYFSIIKKLQIGVNMKRYLIPTYQREPDSYIWNQDGEYISDDEEVIGIYVAAINRDAVIPAYIFANMLCEETISVINNDITI